MNGIMHRKIVLFRSDLFHKSNVGSDLQRSKIITDLYNLKNTSKEIDNTNTGCIR